MSYMIPRRQGEHFDVIVICDDMVLERMRRQDPAQLHVPAMGEPWASLKLRDVFLTYETPEDTAKVIALFRDGKHREAMKFLFRGFEFRPDLGDDDAPYFNLTTRKPS